MVNLFVDIARYLMILFMAVYTYLNFRYFSQKDERKQRKLCAGQNRLMFAIHLLAFAVIWMNTGDIRIPAFYLAQVIFLLVYIYVYRLFYRYASRILVNNMCMLLTVGFIILTRLSFDRALRQFLLVLAAALVTWMIPFIMDRVWQLAKIPWAYGGLGLAILAVVLVAGNKSYGAQLSIGLLGFSFQPSEFVKISFVFFVAAIFYRSTSMRTILLTTAAAALHVLILVASRDLGSGFIFFTTYVFMLFVATGRPLFLAAGAGGGAAASILAYGLFDHVKTRVMAWWNPWPDIDNKGYQITQSLFAIGTGGWFGLGLYQGMPGKIPVVEKDFVFAAISEEMGGIFALCVILICMGCFLQFMMIASRMQAAFYKLIAFGLGIVYIVQVFLTVGGVMKFIPSTGVTLPLVSYGGSSMFSTFMIFGVIQGLYMLKCSEEEEENYEEG